MLCTPPQLTTPPSYSFARAKPQGYLQNSYDQLQLFVALSWLTCRVGEFFQWCTYCSRMHQTICLIICTTEYGGRKPQILCRTCSNPFKVHDIVVHFWSGWLFPDKCCRCYQHIIGSVCAFPHLSSFLNCESMVSIDFPDARRIHLAQAFPSPLQKAGRHQPGAHPCLPGLHHHQPDAI